MTLTESRPLQVLVIEDNPDDLFLLEDMLAEADVTKDPGLQTTHAETLAQARERLDGGRFDLVLSDLTLPDSDRIATFQAVQAAAGDVPVVILSGLQDQELALQAVREGAQDYLLKAEVDSQTLERSIRYALERFRYTAAYERSHAKFKETLEESDAGILVLDRRGRVLYGNPAAQGVLRRDVTQVVGLTLPVDTGDGFRADVQLSAGTAGVLHGHMSETLWEGRLGYLATITRFEVEGEASLTGPQAPVSRFEGLRSSSPRMRKLFATCDRVAPTPASVLLLGETGTGKELLARAIHRRSGRKGRFVAVNCAAIPATLVESELFGHEKGAFTGADQKKLGLFRQAEGGTLMLDEVGNLEMAAQLSLLRTLQERRVRPVGGSREHEVDVRIVAATSVSLFDEVRRGVFREDLLYRLDVIRFEVPPLRSRPEDVLHLFRHFLRSVAERYELDPPQVGPSFLEAMVAHPWPGNVRELENFAERLLLTGTHDCASARDFRDLVRPYAPRAAGSVERPSAAAGPSAEDAVSEGRSLQDFLDEQEKAYVEALLGQSRGRIQVAARAAGINRRTLLRKIKKHDLEKKDYR